MFNQILTRKDSLFKEVKIVKNKSPLFLKYIIKKDSNTLSKVINIFKYFEDSSKIYIIVKYHLIQYN